MISSLNEFASRRTSFHLYLNPRTLNDKQWSEGKCEDTSVRTNFFHSLKQDERTQQLSVICLNNENLKIDKLLFAKLRKKDLSTRLEFGIHEKNGIALGNSSIRVSTDYHSKL